MVKDFVTGGRNLLSRLLAGINWMRPICEAYQLEAPDVTTPFFPSSLFLQTSGNRTDNTVW